MCMDKNGKVKDLSKAIAKAILGLSDPPPGHRLVKVPKDSALRRSSMTAPKRRKMTIYLPVDLRIQLARVCAEQGWSESHAITEAVKDLMGRVIRSSH
jgi:hypothetical protein